jgi:hypothetical protein
VCPEPVFNPKGEKYKDADFKMMDQVSIAIPLEICEPSVGMELDQPTKRLGGAYLSRVGIERPSAV